MVINSPGEYEKARENLFDYDEAIMAAATLLEILRDLKEAELVAMVGDLLDEISASKAEVLEGVDEWEKKWGVD